jgi:predicted small lipoprotein YifL
LRPFSSAGDTFNPNEYSYSLRSSHSFSFHPPRKMLTQMKQILGASLLVVLVLLVLGTAGCGSAGPLVKPEAVPHSPMNGRVVDAASGQPAAGVSVFVAGTTYRATTDGNGSFTLPRVPAGTYELAARQPGYATATTTVPHGPEADREAVLRLSVTGAPSSASGEEDSQASDAPDASALPPATAQAMDEMRQRVEQVEARLALISRQVGLLRDEQRGTVLLAMNEEELDDFKRFFMGKDRENCRLLNTGVLSFQPTGQQESILLRVTTDQPLEVLSRRLGYRLRVVIDEFSVAEAEDETAILGDALVSFEALTPSGEDVAERWREGRHEAYQGSFTHLLRALGAGRSEDEGFSVARPAEVRGRTSQGITGRSYTTTTWFLLRNMEERLYATEKPYVKRMRLDGPGSPRPDGVAPRLSRRSFALHGTGATVLGRVLIDGGLLEGSPRLPPHSNRLPAPIGIGRCLQKAGASTKPANGQTCIQSTSAVRSVSRKTKGPMASVCCATVAMRSM